MSAHLAATGGRTSIPSLVGPGFNGATEIADATGRVRVLTWNAWSRFGTAWRDRPPVLLQQLREAETDVIALQECLQECWGTESTSQAH